ncbi:MAG: hypothetical protein EXS68_00970 [Candidatus Ryanbacteria bacterium]|nr:hypothetical protein [Candidatus Ryanbacteria bacterium]
MTRVSLKHCFFAALFLVVFGLGLAHTIVFRYAMNPDGVSYLDIGDAFWRGDWSAVLTTYWSPLYPFILGFALWLTGSPPAMEFTVVHVVNFVLYLGSFVAFLFFLRTLLDREKIVDVYDRSIFFVFGTSIFLTVALSMITISYVTPDVLVALVMYVVSGLFIIFLEHPKVRHYVMLGSMLGLGYLTKAILFPYALVVFVLLFFVVKKDQKRNFGLGVAGSIFLLCMLPWAFSMSAAKEQFTFGETGTINYAWFNNGVRPFVHWQGEGDAGMPTHPTRKIFDNPVVYEFNDGYTVTYAPWFDPGHWYAGLTPHISLLNTMYTLRVGFSRLVSDMIYYFSFILLMVVVLWWREEDKKEMLLGFWRTYFPLVISSGIILGLYVAVSVESRYTAPFLMVVPTTLFVSIYASTKKRDLPYARIVIVAGTVLAILLTGGRNINDVTNAFISSPRHYHGEVAKGLEDIGVPTGESMAYIGHASGGMNAYWARLARVYIIAEVPEEGQKIFVDGSIEMRIRVLKVFADAGAHWVVWEYAPLYAEQEGWQRIGQTVYYIKKL